MKIAAVFLLISTSLLAQMPAGTRSPLEVEEEHKQAQQQLQQAEDLLQANEFAKARDLLLPLYQKESKDARVAYDLGVAFEAIGDTEKAYGAYMSATHRDPKLFEPQLALGLLLARKGEINFAHQYLRNATGLTPTNGDKSLVARAWRALAHLDADIAPDIAQKDLLEALKLSPETKDDQLLAADLAAKAGNPALAAAAYRRALAEWANDPLAASGLAQTLIKENKFAEAETLLTGALQHSPGDFVLATQLASVYNHKQQPDKAIAVLEPVVKANPDEPSTSWMLADLYVQNGRARDAIPMYEMLLSSRVQRDNPNPVLLDHYAEALIRDSRLKEAQSVLEKALAHPDAFPSKQQLASAASHLAFAASANKDSETVLRAIAIRDGIEAPSATSLFLTATAHDRLHHNKLAVEFYRQFLKEAAGRYPNEEWEAKHRIPVLERGK